MAPQDGRYAFHVSGGFGTKDITQPIGHLGQQVPYHISITIGENSGANRVGYAGGGSYILKEISECRLPPP